MSTPAATPTLRSITLADDPARWAALGFHVEGSTCTIGTTRLEFVPDGEREGDDDGAGLLAWALASGTATPAEGRGDAIDGLVTTWSTDPGAPTTVGGDPVVPATAPAVHPNTATRLDHVVVFTPQLDRTTAALAAAGMDLRRVRDAGSRERPLRQAFYRLGEVILEVVGDVVEAGGPDAPARFWGLVVVVPDVDALASAFGPELLGDPKDAVQAGRRIVTVRRSAGVTVPLAFLTPDPRHD